MVGRNVVDVTIDMSRLCAECGKGGAVDSGICLRCTINAMDAKPMRSATGKAVQARLKQILRK